MTFEAASCKAAKIINKFKMSGCSETSLKIAIKAAIISAYYMGVLRGAEIERNGNK